MSEHELPLPYWFARPASPEQFDCVVVGAGLVGAATVYGLRRQGKRVLLVEADRVAAGATGRSTGSLLTGGVLPFGRLASWVGEDRARRLWEISVESIARMRRDLLDPGEISCDIRPEGSWRTGSVGGTDEGEWKESFDHLHRLGVAASWRSRAAVREACGSDRLGGALFVEQDLGLDPAALCVGLARRSGAEVLEGVRVRRLEPQGGRVLVVWTGGKALAERVVIAVNSQAGPLVPEINGSIRPLGLEAFAVEMDRRVLSGLWVMGGVSARQLEGGTLLVAGRGKRGPGEDPGYLELPTAGGQAALQTALSELLPELLRIPTTHHRWAGAIAMTSDGVPKVGTRGDLPGVAYAAAFNGQGLSVGYEVGRRLAAWVGGDDEALEIF